MQAAYLNGPGVEGIAPVLSWTAPASGYYVVNGSWVVGNQTGGGASMAIADSSGLTYDRYSAALGATNPFAYTKYYTAGSVVQFQVGSDYKTGAPVGLDANVAATGSSNSAYFVDSGMSVTEASSLGGPGGLVKSGAGSLTLSGNNTYSGATTVSAGTLVVNGTNVSATTVQSGATLGGSGAVASATIGSGGTIAPGNSPGTLTLTNGLTWTGGGNYNWQIFNVGGTAGQTNAWDLINVTGGAWNITGLSSSNRFNINLWSLSGLPETTGLAAGFDATQNYSWKILASAGLSGTFSTNLFNINTSAVNGTGGFVGATGLFSLAMDNNDDLFLIYTAHGGAAVPEPGTWAAAVLLALGAACIRRRRSEENAPTKL
jgi:autotransporter-associated beta strand protein